jgi:hypothetical protein
VSGLDFVIRCEPAPELCPKLPNVVLITGDKPSPFTAESALCSTMSAASTLILSRMRPNMTTCCARRKLSIRERNDKLDARRQIV